MTTPLEALGQASRARAESAMRDRPLFDLETVIESLPPIRRFGARLSKDAGPFPRVIAGMTRRVAGSGSDTAVYRPRQIAMGFARVGAAALSVTTEPDKSGGDVDHISEARPAHLPILRDDFLVTPYQIAQSRVAGADAVLLIAGLLRETKLEIMLKAAQRYGVEVLVEIDDEETLGRAIDAGAVMIAINNTQRGTTPVDLDTGIRLCSKIPPGCLRIAGDGIENRGQIESLSSAGFDAMFISQRLMNADDPADALWALMQPPSSTR